MTTTITSQDLQAKFQAVFGERLTITLSFHQTENLIGEHTDYNLGISQQPLILVPYGAARKREGIRPLAFLLRKL